MINRSDSLARGDNRLLRETLNTFHSSSLYKKRKCQHLAVIVSTDWTISSFVRSEALSSGVAWSPLCMNENVQGSYSVFSVWGKQFHYLCNSLWFYWSIILNFLVLLNEITPDSKTAALFSFPISSKCNFFTSTKTCLWESYVRNGCAVLQFFCGMLEN